MRLAEAQKIYREERDKADKRRRAALAPIMRAAKKALEEFAESRRPKRGRPKKGSRGSSFPVDRRDPLEIPNRFRTGGN